MLPGSYTVATLPQASKFTGNTLIVTDATLSEARGSGSTVVGGGTTRARVLSDGLSWRVMGWRGGTAAKKSAIAVATVDFTTGALPANVTYAGSVNGSLFSNTGVLQFPAVNTPRYTWRFDGSAWVIAGLLNEGASSSSLLQSSALSTAPWTLFATTMNVNSDVSPDGTTNAEKMNEAALFSGHSTYQPVTIAANTYNAFTAMFKAGTRQFAFLSMQGGTDEYASVVFDLVSKAASQISVGVVSGDVLLTRVIDIGGGYFICGMVCKTGFINANYVVGLSDVGSGNPPNSNGDIEYTGDITKNIVMYGANVQIGTELQSYVPTVAGIVTRTANVLTIGSAIIANGTYNVAVTRDKFGTLDVTNIPGVVVSGGYVVPVSPYPVRRVAFF